MENLQNVLQGKEKFYSFLSDILFFPPNEKQLVAFSAFAPFMLEYIHGTEYKELEEVGKALNILVEKLKNSTQEQIEEYIKKCNIEYSEIFYIGKIVPVTESNYLSPGKQSNYKYVDEVLEIYAVAGYKAELADSNEPADHIGFELGFLAETSANMQISIRNNNGENLLNGLLMQKDFMEKHLMLWLGQLCSNVSKRGLDHNYMTITITVLQYFAQDDFILLQNILEDAAK